jgi:prepilin-type N-terminal cleavage/methylation domain-containing protein
MQGASKSRSRAFTLVELLVAIAIIAILIALLSTVLGKARRKAIILASPIVYHSFNDNALHLTDPTLGWDTKLFFEPTDAYDRRPGGVMWSPSGQKIGFHVINWLGHGPQFICICNPMTRDLRKYPQMPAKEEECSYFMGWVDDANFIERADNNLFVRSADTGAVMRTVSVEHGVSLGQFHLMPVGASEPYLVGYGGGIYAATRDFRPARTIFAPPAESVP